MKECCWFPQHFQMLCTRYEGLFERALAGEALPRWSVMRTEIDRSRLVSGT
ncbi:MAG: hypothetical protein R2729_06235 [Bryobacteraceae bacterium]